MNTYFERWSAVILTASLVLVSVFSVTFAAGAPAEVEIDTINGETPTGHCIAGTLTLVGHGLTGPQGGPYKLDIGWGDGSATTTISTGDPEITSGILTGSNKSFTFSASHTPTAESTGLTVFLHHSQAPGNDSNVIIINQCVAPPTQGVVIVEKHVVNDDGGNAVAPDFTLHLGSENFAGSEEGTDIL